MKILESQYLSDFSSLTVPNVFRVKAKLSGKKIQKRQNKKVTLDITIDGVRRMFRTRLFRMTELMRSVKSPPNNLSRTSLHVYHIWSAIIHIIAFEWLEKFLKCSGVVEGKMVELNSSALVNKSPQAKKFRVLHPN